ncbi:MAG: hypothetical protein M0Z58_04765 [Nitrospiraceae bacterium]|nr:hypothetical protein [Nitrospiraceae bacterium]
MRRFRSLFFAAPVLAALVFAPVIVLAAPPAGHGRQAMPEIRPAFRPARAQAGGVMTVSADDPPLSSVLMKLAVNDPVHSKALLGQALLASPDLPPVYFRLAAADLKEFPGGLVSGFYYAVRGFESYARNWWWAMDLSGLAGVSLIASFFICLFVTVCLRLPRELPLLKHDIAERSRYFLLLLVPAVSAFFGPGLFLASVLLLLGIYFPRRDRILVLLVMLFAAFMPFVRGWVNGVYLVSNPQMRAIVGANEGIDNSLAVKALAGSGDFAGLFSYGLGLQRSGRPSQAIVAYSAAIERRKDPRAYVNLANCYMFFGEPGKADELYTKSLAIRPTAAAYFDLARLDRDSLDYEKAGALYRQAANLDPAGLSQAFMDREGKEGGRLLMDDTLGMADFYSIFDKTRRGAGQGASSVLLWSVLILWLAVFFYFGKGGRMRAFRCSRCGRILCDRCERQPYWGRMCGDCYQSLVKLEARDPKKRVARLLMIHGSQLRHGALVRALGFAPPGIAYIYGGSILKGALMLWGFLFFAVAAAANPLFTTGLGTGRHDWLGAVSAAVCGLLYILSFVGARRRQGRQWL